MEKLLYALKNNSLVSINEVESGKKCGCVCPSCGSLLIAKKGNIKIHHFAHMSNSNCSYGHETSLHLLAKKIIEESEDFMLPREIVASTYYNGKAEKGVKINGVNEPINIRVDKVEVENIFDDIKPDLVIYSGQNKYFVEIFVTHKVDEEKRKKIRNINVDTIEIDLSSFKESIDEEKLRKIILSDNVNKYWVYNKKVEYLINDLRKRYTIKTKHHGLALHSDYCPINMRTYYGKSFANVIHDCIGCDYFFSLDDDLVICSAAKPQEFDNIKYMDKNKKCPKCRGRLVVKHGSYGAFYGCENYPKCKYTSNL